MLQLISMKLRFFLSLSLFFVLFLSITAPIYAQRVRVFPSPTTSEEELATKSAEATGSAVQAPQQDVTKPETDTQRNEFLALFSKREIDSPTLLNIVAYIVQYAVKVGVPANTILLIFVLPVLATLSVFVRHIIGLPSLETIVPVALAITLLSTGVTVGALLLITIFLASTLARLSLKHLRIMQLPKMALSMLVVAILVFAALVLGASYGILEVRNLSIFPVLLLIILSDKIVALQLTRGVSETFLTTMITLILGLIGFALMSSSIVRQYMLLYPEFILLLVPINILMGRYFGLRITEMYRFSAIRKYGNK